MKLTTKQLTASGLLAALSVVIMFLEFNLPFIPPFLQLDFSDVPALVGAVSISPVVGIAVIIVKNLIHLLMTSTGGAGEFANVIMGCCYIIPIALTAKKGGIKAISGTVAGILAMTAVAMLFNYFILIPWYSKVMPIETIINMCSEVNSLIDSKLDIIIFGVIPFNLMKGIINTFISFAILKYIKTKR